MSALPLEPESRSAASSAARSAVQPPAPSQSHAQPAISRVTQQWPLIPKRSGSSRLTDAFRSASRPGRLGQLAGDVLIGLPLAVGERAVAGISRLRRR